MKQWEKLLRHVATNAENQFDTLWHRIERRFNHSPIMIQPYMGYGNRQIIRLHGRVMQDNGIRQAEERDTLWDNLLNTYRRFATDEIPYAVIKAKIADEEAIVTADEEGYFKIEIISDFALADTEIMQTVELQLLEIPGLTQTENITFTPGSAIVPATNAEYGIISDLDDTVIQSDVVHLIKLAKNTFLRNAQTRLPFSGVAAFYRALKVGAGNIKNPIFYVSNSPWNLYDLLTDFLDLKEIPVGPIFLQDIGLNKDQWLTKPHHMHKSGAIQEILDLHPNLPFVLIGDSTEHDAEIYFNIAMANPDRIKVIYIRNVDSSQRQNAYITGLANQLIKQGTGTMLHLVTDTTEAALNAIELGLIKLEALPEIKGETEHDEEQPNLIEQVIGEGDET